VVPGRDGLDHVWAFDVWNRLAAEDASMPLPPYQVRFDDGDMVVGVEVDAEAVRPLVPSGLTLPNPATGGFVIYSASTGWGITPYTAAFAWVDVEGMNAPDGTRGRLKIGGLYSGSTATKAFSALSRHCRAGYSRKEFSGDLVTAIAGSGGAEHFRILVRRLPGPGRPQAGTRYYLGDPGGGRLTWMAMSYTFTAGPAEPLEAVITAPPGEPLALFRPRKLLWATFLRDKVATLGVPMRNPPAAEAGEPDREMAAVTALLGRIHRPAVVIDAGHRVRYRNGAAAGIVADGITINGEILAASVTGDRPALDELIAEAGTGSTPRTMALARPSGRKPLLVQATRLAGTPRGDGDPPLVLLIFTDPDAVVGDTLKALQLLGLTPAEARAAALIGSGLSPREAAELLGNSEGTVRVTLNRVFQKLDIGRQSELARLVNRIDPLFA